MEPAAQETVLSTHLRVDGVCDGVIFWNRKILNLYPSSETVLLKKLVRIRVKLSIHIPE